MGYPSGKLKLALWQDTDYEEIFDIHFPKNKTPYVKAYGIKYELTQEEIEMCKKLEGITDGLNNL